MIKKMKGWKVIVGRKRRSILYTTFSYKASLIYPVNVEVKPSIPGSKLFFFKERADADGFCLLEDEQIVPCIAKNVTKPKYILNDLFYIVHFWEWKNKHPRRSIKEYRNKEYNKPISIAPIGTYWADSITCLE